MKNELWDLVDEALNERRDPFECAALSRALAEDPEASRRVRLLVDRLERLQIGAPPQPSALSKRTPKLVLAGAAAAISIAFSVYLRLADSAPASSPRTVKTISLVVSHSSPSPARPQRVVLESQPVVAWSLQGENQ